MRAKLEDLRESFVKGEFRTISFYHRADSFRLDTRRKVFHNELLNPSRTFTTIINERDEGSLKEFFFFTSLY